MSPSPPSPSDANDPGGAPSAEDLLAEQQAEQAIEELSFHTSSDRYEIRGEVARGGQGAVLKVWDRDLRRELAMKVRLEPDGRGDSSQNSRSLLRFIEEAHVTGQLDHPGIVPVHEMGLDSSGKLFFTMKLVKGRTLAEIIEELRRGNAEWSRTRVVSIVLKVCEAMAYAHDKKVIHRDLKPSNIMVGRFGEVYVMDWGLAKVLAPGEASGAIDGPDVRVQEPQLTVPLEGESTGVLLTMDGSVIGTPAYMSPEQAMGDVGAMGPRSDVYAVGAILYHVLTGISPYGSPGLHVNPVMVWRFLQKEPPVPIRELAQNVPDELEAICEKAMARAPAERYATTKELGDDLRAYLEMRVVRAYERGPIAELRKWVKRNRALAAAAALAILALAVGLVVSVTLGREAEHQRRNVMRLSAFREIDGLEARAEELWPVDPELIPAYDAWLDDAETLVAKTPGLRAQLVELRASGSATDPEALERALREQPDYEELEQLELELSALERAERIRTGREEPEPFVLDPQTSGLDPDVLNDLAWPLVSPRRSAFGRESEGLGLAQRALEKAGEDDDVALIHDTLAWAFLVNGLDEEALAASRTALELAPEDERKAYRSRLERVEAAVERAASPEALAALEDLRSRRGRMRERLTAGLAFTFEDQETSWWYSQLTRLVRELESFARPNEGPISGVSDEWGWSVQRRREVAERVERESRTGDVARRLWERARGAIRAHPDYGGLDLRPQYGLLPMGPDPQNGLWEFAHLASGEVPARDADGRIEIRSENALVLVLLPGGRFTMGAQSTDPSAPRYDLRAEADEGPPHDLFLEPFFLSKYETTQAQWKRMAGSNPSVLREGLTSGTQPIDDRHPVENLDWNEALETLERFELRLPSEAQWEYAARAGEQTAWFTGGERESLVGFANLADSTAVRAGQTWPALADWPELDDGFAHHAPVGQYAANGFGLHDVAGNVVEWCADIRASYSFPTFGPTAQRMGNVSSQRISRGGSYMLSAADARVSYRLPRRPAFRFQDLGVRSARAVLADENP